MLVNYIKSIEELIATSPEVIEFIILRRSFYETDLEKILIYRFKVKFKDNSTVEITERLIEFTNKIKRTKYSYHFQDKNGKLIKRWDNAPHHPEIESYPHHLHISESRVIKSNEISGFDILKELIGRQT